VVPGTRIAQPVPFPPDNDSASESGSDSFASQPESNNNPVPQLAPIPDAYVPPAPAPDLGIGTRIRNWFGGLFGRRYTPEEIASARAAGVPPEEWIGF
jgi:hypothetical protein